MTEPGLAMMATEILQTVDTWRLPMRILATFSAVVLATLLFSSAQAQQGPAGLYVWDQNNSSAGGNVIRELDETVPSAGSIVSQTLTNAPDVEYGNGNFYNSGNNGVLQVIDANSGLITNSVTLDFSGSFNNVVTALEFVDGFLYGAATLTGSPFNPAALAIIDLDSGAVNNVGSTNIFGPLGGLAYDGDTLFAVEAGNTNPTDLYTLDLATGAATSVGSTGVQLTGLEFGNDGVLYGLGQGANENQLFEIDPNTGQASLIGEINGVTGRSITAGPVAVPEPSSMMLLAGSMIALVIRRRR